MYLSHLSYNTYTVEPSHLAAAKVTSASSALRPQDVAIVDGKYIAGRVEFRPLCVVEVVLLTLVVVSGTV